MAESSKAGIGAKIGICLIMTLQFTQGLVTPGLAAMQASFPDAPSVLVQTLATIAQVFTIAAIVLPALLRKFGYKKMTLATIILQTLGGLGVALIGPASFWGVFFFRIVFGIGYGFVFSLTLSYVGVLFAGRTRSIMLGVVIGVGGAASIIFSIVAGKLSAINWTYSFWFQAAWCLIIGLIAWFLLPEPDNFSGVAAAQEPVEETGKDKGNFTFPANFWIMMVAILFGLAFITTFMNNAAMVVVGGGMAQDPSLVFTCMSLGMTIGSFLYGPVHSALKRFTHPVILILFAGCYVAYCLTNSVMAMSVTAVIFGLTFGMLNPCWTDILMMKAKNDPDRANSMFVIFAGIGQFLSPVIAGGCASGVAAITGMAVFSGLRAQWWVAMPILIVAAIVVLVLNIVHPNDVVKE